MKKVSNPEIEALTKEQLKALKDAAIVAAHEKRVKKAELRKKQTEALKSKTIPSPEAIAISKPVDVEKFAKDLAIKKQAAKLLRAEKKQRKIEAAVEKTTPAEPATEKIKRLRDANRIEKKLREDIRAEKKKNPVPVPTPKAKKHIRTKEEEAAHLENLSAIRLARIEKKQQQEARVAKLLFDLKNQRLVAQAKLKERKRLYAESEKEKPRPWVDAEKKTKVTISDKVLYKIHMLNVKKAEDYDVSGKVIISETKVMEEMVNPQGIQKFARNLHNTQMTNKDNIDYYGITVTRGAEHKTQTEVIRMINTSWKKIMGKQSLAA